MLEQVNDKRSFSRTEEVVEKLANVFIGLESVVNGGLEPSVDVSEVKLSVKSQEHLVYNTVSFHLLPE